MRFLVLLFLLFALFPPYSIAQPASHRAILEIIVNGQNTGQQFVRVTPDGDVLLMPRLLEDLRLRRQLWAEQKGEQISLRSLSPNIQFSLDQNNAMLNLAVPPHWFEKQVIVKEAPPKPAQENAPLRPLAWSGFLNYNFQASFSGQDSLSRVDAPWELGFNVGQWLALATFDSRYDANTQTTETLRQRTSLLWDDPENMRSLTLGDFTPQYSLLGGGGNFAGIAWRKNFRLDQNFRYASDLSLETVIESPTHAQLYSNGRQVKEWDLLPGVVNFADISSYAGGDAELVLTDAFGREQRLSVPSYTSQQVLKKGLHEYAYSLGWQRKNLGQASNDYGKLTALGFHRYGFGETWTGGAAFAATGETVAAGPMLAALLGAFGQIETGFLSSQDKEQGTGYTATARYSYRYKKLNAYLGLTSTSREYVAIPSLTDRQSVEGMENTAQSRYQGNLSLNYASTDWGSLSAGYSENRSWSGKQNRLLSLTYRKSFQALQLSVGLRHDLEVENNDEVYVSLQYHPKTASNAKSLYDNLSAESRYHQTDGRENKLSLQKTYPRGTGYGYAADFSEKQGEVFANARGQYTNERGIFTAHASRSVNGDISGSVSAAGGLALIEGGLYQGRPITDSFAVVQVAGLEALTVENGNSPVGQTGSSGALLVPDLSSYHQNRLSIAAPNLPMNYTAPVLEQAVEVKQRGGSLVKFQFNRFAAVEGNLYLPGADGEKIKLQALPLELMVNSEKRSAFLGLNGYFYLENLPIGAYLLRVRRAGGDCLTRINIPDSARIVVNLGELACALEK